MPYNTKKAYIIGTYDTKADELLYIAGLIRNSGIDTCLVDVSTSPNYSSAENIDISCAKVASFHPKSEKEVLRHSDRGEALAEMKIALQNFVHKLEDVGGMIGAGGSGNTDLVSAALRALPIGTPKVMVSTVGSGDVAPYIGPNDIAMVYSVTDVAGLNSISRRVLGNAAHALSGMIKNNIPQSNTSKPALGMTMFGVTTQCVDQLREKLDKIYDCLVFHATGVGGQSMEKLAESNLLVGTIDVTTTEVCDLIAGGVFSAGPDRFDRLAKSGLPYVGSCGALDMVNFGALDTVPGKYKDRNLYIHNANVTLMRTNKDECRKIGEFIAKKLNTFTGPVRFIFPEKGFSLLDSKDQQFYDPEANNILLDSLRANLKESAKIQLIILPLHINDYEFSEALSQNWNSIAGEMI
tara:strand:- start:46800 stop:48026 length:1227 start_codon:yes stop_codon:yes gene_type:complete